MKILHRVVSKSMLLKILTIYGFSPIYFVHDCLRIFLSEICHIFVKFAEFQLIMHIFVCFWETLLFLVKWLKIDQKSGKNFSQTIMDKIFGENPKLREIWPRPHIFMQMTSYKEFFCIWRHLHVIVCVWHHFLSQQR